MPSHAAEHKPDPSPTPSSTLPNTQNHITGEAAQAVDVALAHGRFVVVGQPIQLPEAYTTLTYTVGMASLGHPDIVVFGLDREVAADALHQLGQALLDGSARPDEPLQNVFDGLPALLKEIDADMYREVVKGLPGFKVPQGEMLQLLWPDINGHFPWEPGFVDCYEGCQPMLYRFC